MKRKRFIKLVMSRGFQRNEAERIATMVSAHGSYEALYEWLPSGPGFENLKMAVQYIGGCLLDLIRPILDRVVELYERNDWAQFLEAGDDDDG